MIQPVGYFKIWRELFTKPIWQESTPEQKVILLTLLAMANFDEKEWEWEGKQYRANKGQFVTSLRSIAETAGNGITIKKVRTAIDRFEKYGFLANKSTNKNRLITIVNWELYQSNEDKKAKKKASKGQAVGKQRATREEGKEVKNISAENSAREISDYFCNKHMDTLNVKYKFNGGKDGKAIKTLMKMYDVDFIKGLIDWYFKTDDPFINDVGREIAKMQTFVSKYIAYKQNKPDKKESTIGWL